MEYTLDDFIDGRFAVNCTTYEDAEEFIVICVKNGIKFSKIILLNWQIYKEKTCYNYIYKNLVFDSKEHYDNKNITVIDFKELIGENKMNKAKTLKEVINDIKEGEIWECKYMEIYIKNNDLYTIPKDGKKYDGIVFRNDTRYTLKRKEYNFTEAYKAYKEGKEIESLVSGYRLKIIDDVDMFYSTNGWENIKTVEYKEIDGKWYIND